MSENMALPPLYKFLDVRGAKLTLGNNTFRHAKPSDCNDTEDLTLQSIFPEDLQAALIKAATGFPDVIARNLDAKPTCKPSMAKSVVLLQAMFKAKPELAEVIKREMLNGEAAKTFDAEHMRLAVKETIDDINKQLQRARVLCVTTHKDSDHMWNEYAQKHEGIAIRIEGNAKKASKFERFAPVTYRGSRPSLFEGALSFVKDALFGDAEKRTCEIMDKIIYSKTVKWEPESEYRLVIHLGQDEPEWDTLRYHPEEVTELYLGSAMKQQDKADILATAKALNPNIKVFQAKRNAKGVIAFDAV